MEHYGGIIGGYGVAVGLFWLAFLVLRGPVLTVQAYAPARPIVEVCIAAVVIIAVIGAGQLYMRGWLLPDEGELRQSLNQVLIFSPVLAAAALRGQFLRALFLPSGLAAIGALALGLLLAACAIIAYVLVRGLSGEWGEVAAHLAQPGNISLAVQVLMEDLAIAFLLARLRAATGPWWTIAIVAVLFQLAHIPAFLANGATVDTLSSLVLDTAIGLAVFGAILRSRNVLWFWPVHAVLDLMQFY